ncbi:MAG: site-specific integrase [Lactobacillus sp.]|nr:site-specific integrase [Lactobacillus sp.]
MYPYQSQFETWATSVRHLANTTVVRASLAVNSFWNYYRTVAVNNCSLNDITESDIRSYLINLENREHLKASTINKYLSYIKIYFDFLFSHQIINTYPPFNIKGNFTSRKRNYIIGWNHQLSKIINIPNINVKSIALLTAVNLGFKPDDILSLRFSDIEPNLDNSKLRDYFVDHLDFKNSNNPFLFQNRSGKPYTLKTSLYVSLSNDSKALGFPLTITYLRLSYIYTLLTENNLSDPQLIEKLKISPKSLIYYKTQLITNISTKSFEINSIE